MAITLAELIEWKFEGAVPNEDFTILDYGYGQTITSWNLSEPPPSLQDVTEWASDPAFLAWKLERTKDAAYAELRRQRGAARLPVEPYNIYLQEMALAGKFIQAFVYTLLKQAVPTWEPQPSMFPVLYGMEAGVLGLDADGMAAFVVEKGLSWLQFNDAIDAIAAGIEQTIGAATNETEVAAALDAQWPQLPPQDS